MKLWNLIRKYKRRAETNSLSGAKIVKEFNYPVLVSMDKITFEYMVKLVGETKKVCAEAGYEIDQIIFFSAYYADILDDHFHVRSSSDDYMAVYKRKNDGTFFAVLFSGSWIMGEK
tara:strand:+ start:2390 stop:2737 length:348 start_codon:yes stop_codon:yes gene_type:complete